MITTATQDFLDRLDSMAPKDIVKLVASSRVGDETKLVTVDIDKKKFPNGIEILHLTDVQYGAKDCKVDKFVEYREWVLAEPNRFVIFGGDMIDAATVLSVASPYSNTGEPQEQIYNFVELAMPLRHRILGSVGGNHERRTSRTFGDAGSLIARLLKIPYSQGVQFIDINYGEHKPFRNAVHHGVGASQTAGAKMSMLEKFAKRFPGNDMYWVGHLHDCFCKYWTQVERKNGEIKMKKYAGVMSSSFLDYFGTYADAMMLEANDLHMWKVALTPDGKWSLTIR